MQCPTGYPTDGKGDEICPFLFELGYGATHRVEADASDLGDIKRRFGKAHR